MLNIFSRFLEFLASNVWMFFAGATLACLLLEYLRTSIKNKKSDKIIVMDTPFENETSNDLYALSFTPPFSQMVIDDKSHPKVKDIETMISEAEMNDKLNYRVYTVIQTSILIIAVVVFLVMASLVRHLPLIVKLLFNIQMPPESIEDPTTALMIIGGCLLGTCLIPKMYLSKTANARKFGFLKDLPILQLFIILVLRAKRPINELLYVLSKTETRYKEVFAVGYRIYVRDKEEGFEYIKKAFIGTKMIDTIKILEEFNDYSKSESLNMLENNLEEIIHDTSTMKRNKDIVGNIISQGSLLFPMMGVVLLGLVPIVMYGMSSLNDASTGVM